MRGEIKMEEVLKKISENLIKGNAPAVE